ncbi:MULTISPECIES: hypothetical protein [unclassified Coleofasciculus]|uniref:hypothetical protein n=1 Tax=unclassified Coleofasciculus TaxID=2692782 RepID=UPI001881E854|nr:MULTISPECIES: hypothetical protein [unclassified Coleofasciculus]MBE9124932.1 hypothetical protein [Coleofasciculus sp. LEGE 07081]MBE9147956.1 hypothetical protein [Coleofasciculus sp. LEGE 07092]
MTKHTELNDGDCPANNKALERLIRAISMSQGQFSLILVCCQCSPQPLQVLNQLQELSSLPVQGVRLHPSVDTLFTAVFTSLEEPPPPALVVFGLESVVEVDRVLNATNLVRDEFRKQFPFPLVLWINDEILQKLIRLAPDFKSWAANPIRLELPNNQCQKQTSRMVCVNG